MRIKYPRSPGFTLVEIMIVVAIIGLLAAIAIPNFIKAREYSQKSTCIANLKQIEGAKSTWALENKRANTESPIWPTDLIGDDKYIRDEPICPAGGAYVPGAVRDKTTCPNSAALGHTL